MPDGTIRRDCLQQAGQHRGSHGRHITRVVNSDDRDEHVAQGSRILSAGHGFHRTQNCV
jgi:hypothetical protein